MSVDWERLDGILNAVLYQMEKEKEQKEYTVRVLEK